MGQNRLVDERIKITGRVASAMPELNVKLQLTMKYLHFLPLPPAINSTRPPTQDAALAKSSTFFVASFPPLPYFYRAVEAVKKAARRCKSESHGERSSSRRITSATSPLLISPWIVLPISMRPTRMQFKDVIEPVSRRCFIGMNLLELH